MDYPSTMMASSTGIGENQYLNSTTSATIIDDDPFTINSRSGNVSIPFFWPLLPSPPILSDDNNNSSTIEENLDEIEFWKDIYSKNNMQPGVGWKIPQYYSLPYQVIGTIFQGIILIVGVLGNVMVVIVVLRSRSMRTPTNCYLVSLAVADTMVLLASVPNEIIAYYLLGDKWIWGPIGCALFIFLQYLGINASSLSIAAFTVERYIAICHPMLAHKLCTVRRAKRIIMYVWMFATTYCAPWLFLTKTERIHYLWVETEVYTCKFKLNREHYKGYFLTDIVLFYILPLLIACVLYALIARILYNSNDIIFHKAHKSKKNIQQQHSPNVTTSSSSSTTTTTTTTTTATAKITNAPNSGSTPSHNNNNNNFGSTSTIIKMNSEKVTGCDSKKNTSTSDSSRVQVVKMLAVVVAVFATLWLPYRALVVYNSFTFPPYMELWYLMFAKTMIFVNSAINPIIYSACSMKFRREFKRMLTCNTKGYLRNTTMAGGGGAYRNAYRMDGVTISMASTSNQPTAVANDSIKQNTNNKNQRFRIKKSSANTIAKSSGEEPKSSSESLLLETIDKKTNHSDSLNNKTVNNNNNDNNNNNNDNDNVQCSTIIVNNNNNFDSNSNSNLTNNNLNNNKKSALKTTASITVYHHNDNVVGGSGSSGAFRTETIITSDTLNCQEHQF